MVVVVDATPTIVIVTGSRDWVDPRPILDRLDQVLAEGRPVVLFEGECRGADRIARSWARAHENDGVELVPMPARWTDYPANARWRAGRDRNEQMLRRAKQLADETGGDVRVLAFKRNFDWRLRKGGTEHMVSIAKDAGVPGVVVGTPKVSA